jgi:hypothetical protein
MFNDRENAAENKFAHDKETEFRTNARRNKLLGQWAAGRMNLSGAAADEYSKALIVSNVKLHDDDGIVARVKADFSAKGLTISEHDIREELFRVSRIAAEQIQGE